MGHPRVVWGHRHGTHSLVGISESNGGRTSVTGLALCLVAAVCYAGGVMYQTLALRHASAVQVTTFGCFTGTA